MFSLYDEVKREIKLVSKFIIFMIANFVVKPFVKHVSQKKGNTQRI